MPVVVERALVERTRAWGQVRLRRTERLAKNLSFNNLIIKLNPYLVRWKPEVCSSTSQRRYNVVLNVVVGTSTCPTSDLGPPISVFRLSSIIFLSASRCHLPLSALFPLAPCFFAMRSALCAMRQSIRNLMDVPLFPLLFHRDSHFCIIYNISVAW